MAHYAFLDADNIVIDVIVGIDETQLIEGKAPEEWYGDYRGQKCVRTSYNGKIRYNYAGIGYEYDAVNDAFIAPKPCDHQELVLDEKSFKWSCTSEEHRGIQIS
jgi:hypothetical protein